MIRVITISFFIGLILFKPISQFSWEVWYQINKAYVAEELCENKERIDLQCNGKCYLMKQLKKAETQKKTEHKKDRSNPYVSKQKSNWINASFILQFSTSPHKRENINTYYYLNLYSKNQPTEIFHPPQTLS